MLNSLVFNQKTVNSLLMQQLAAGMAEWTATERNTLLAIASQCPLSGGDAVFQARALLAGTDDLPDWDDATNCEPAHSRGAGSQNSLSPKHILVFPNPAIDWVNIQLAESDTKDASQPISIELFNLTGSLIRAYQFEGGQPLLHLSLAGLPEGLYLGRLTIGGSYSDSFKIQRIKG